MNAVSKIAVVAAAISAVTSAFAAEPLKVAALGDVTGKVMVNQGRGFVSAKPGMEIHAGDRIVALDGASAQVVYGDGCVADLKENNLLSVDGKCATKAVNPRSENIKLAQAIGAAPATGGGAAMGGGAAAGAGFAGALPLIGAGVIFGAAVNSHNDQNDSAPISPQ